MKYLWERFKNSSLIVFSGIFLVTIYAGLSALLIFGSTQESSMTEDLNNVIEHYVDSKSTTEVQGNDFASDDTDEAIDPAKETTSTSTEDGEITTSKTTSKITSVSSSSTVKSTTILPEAPSAYVAFYADNQSDSDAEDVNHQRAVNYILNSGTNPIFHAGDIMEDGTQNSLDRFNSVTTTLRASRVFYAALGNNDRKVGDPSTPSQLFLDNFSFPGNERWYSVNYGNLHIIVLDSAFAAGSATQLAWLSSDLQSSASQSRITGVVFHHPTFTGTILQMLIDYNADFVVAGHYHSYSHSVISSIHQFVMSGQPNIGYMTATVYADHVSFTARNQNNAVIQNVTVNDR